MFLLIERPGEHDGLPEDDDFETIGQFYEAIEEALKRLAARARRGRALLRRPGAAGHRRALLRRQRPDRHRHRPRVGAGARSRRSSSRARACSTRRSGTATATCSIPEREEVAHYFRFNELYVGRRYAPGDTPQSGPDRRAGRRSTGTPSDTCGRIRARADYPDGSPIREQMEEFNHAYSAVLHLLHEMLQRQPAAARGRDRRDVRAQGRGVEADAAPDSGDGETTVGPQLRVGAAASSATSSGSSRAEDRRRPRTARTSSTATSRSSRKKKLVSAQNDAIAWRKTETIETEETYALCRCGQSSTKPFCDGTHARIGFDGTETRRPAADGRADPDRATARCEASGETVLEGPGSSSSATATCACTPRSASAGSSGSPR